MRFCFFGFWRLNIFFQDTWFVARHVEVVVTVQLDNFC